MCRKCRKKSDGGGFLSKVCSKRIYDAKCWNKTVKRNKSSCYKFAIKVMKEVGIESLRDIFLSFVCPFYQNRRQKWIVRHILNLFLIYFFIVIFLHRDQINSLP